MKSVYHSKNPSRTGLKSLEEFRVQPERLTHEFTQSPAVERAVPLVNTLITDAKAWFCSRYGEEFDRYNPDHGAIMKPRMWEDARMAEALALLGLPLEHVQKIYLPWWNESAGSETLTTFQSGIVYATLGARHTYQTQMMRQGLDIPGICSVSVAGFVHTSDDRLVLGLRGGLNYPNTYYFAAGALAIGADMQAGRMSIYQLFLKDELRKEYGILRDDISMAELLCKAALHGGDRDVSYVFAVHTPLSLDGVLARYASNSDKDKLEHNRLEGVRPDEVPAFVREFYKGFAANNPHRPEGQRMLLPQGAGPLLSYVGEGLELMDELAAKNIQPA
jgi:hypothetical protein